MLIHEQRGRVYLKSNEEDGTPIYGAPSKKCSYGCPAYSLGEPYHNEVMLPKGYKTVVDWLWEVACTGEGYENPQVADKEEIEIEEVEWTDEVEADDKRETGAAGDEWDAPPTDWQEAAGKDGLEGNPEADNANDGDGGENGRSAAAKGEEAGGVQGGENGDAGASPAAGSTGVETD